MGKGGTKFEGEAIGVRSGRQKTGVSLKDVKKNMEVSLCNSRYTLSKGKHRNGAWDLGVLISNISSLTMLADLSEDRKTSCSRGKG